MHINSESITDNLVFVENNSAKGSIDLFTSVVICRRNMYLL